MKKYIMWLWAVLFILLLAVSGCSFLKAEKNIKELTVNRNFDSGSDNSKQAADQSFVNNLNELVKKNIITQKQADAVARAFRDQQPGMRTLTSLISNGTITKSQAQEINKAIYTRPNTKLLAQLVKEGTITQTQADAVIRAMRPTTGGSSNISEAVAQLMKSGTLNQSQANAIIKAVAAGGS
ncbi:MAG: hypothetical protein ACM3NT_03495 [Methylocystaceae bacterium]